MGRFNFISAKKAWEMTDEAERIRKECAEARAIKILEDFDFNTKVQERANAGERCLREPLFVDDMDVADAVCKILQDLGYTARAQNHGYGSKGYRIIIGWSQVTTRAMAGEKR